MSGDPKRIARGPRQFGKNFSDEILAKDADRTRGGEEELKLKVWSQKSVISKKSNFGQRSANQGFRLKKHSEKNSNCGTHLNYDWQAVKGASVRRRVLQPAKHRKGGGNT